MGFSVPWRLWRFLFFFHRLCNPPRRLLREEGRKILFAEQMLWIIITYVACDQP